MADQTDRPGKRADLRCLWEDAWLLDCAVLYRIIPRNGRFYVTLLFVYKDDPLRFRAREIDHYPTEAKARVYGKLLQRGTRRDPRGTIKINPDDFHFCHN